MDADMVLEFIYAIGGCWKLVAALLLIIFTMIFYRQIGRAIDRISVIRLQKGNTEIEIQQSDEDENH